MSPGVEISKRLVLINTVSSVLQRIVSLGILVWVTQQLMKKIPAAENELYAVLMVLLVFVPLLTGILGGALARYVTVAYAKGDTKEVTAITSTMLPLAWIGSVLILLAGLPLAWFIDSVVDIGVPKDAPDNSRLVFEGQIMFAILAGIAAFRVAFLPFRLGLNVKQKFIAMHQIGLASELLRLGIIIGCFNLIDYRALWVVIATVPSTLLEVIVTVVMSRRLMPSLRFERSAIRKDLFKPILTYGWWTLLIRLVVMLRETASLLILNHHPSATDAQTVAFQKGSMVDNQLRRNALIMVPALQPAMTAMYATGQHERLRRTYFRFCRYLLWVFLFAIVPLVLYRRAFWAFYLGGKTFAVYRDVAPVMTLLLARLLVMFPQAPISVIAFARGTPRALSLCQIAIEVTTIVVGAYLVVGLDMGARGMAWAVLITSLVLQPLLIWNLGMRMIDARLVGFARYAVLPGLLPALIATPVWYGTKRLMQPHNSLELALNVSIGALIYAVAIYTFCLQSTERADLHRALGRIKRRFARS
ncbi:MAG: hypothetical protein AAF628_00500 [Planctomycetota bacterium]